MNKKNPDMIAGFNEMCADINVNSDNKGETWVAFEKGKFKVNHPSQGPFPVVVPGKNLLFKVNGEEKCEPTPVSMGDRLEVEVINEYQKGSWSIEISTDGLEALLSVEPSVKIERYLPDFSPAERLHLEPLEIRTYESPLTPDELLSELKKLNISYGIDWPACVSVSNIKEPTKIIVARGRPPEHGIDPRIEILFPTEEKEVVHFEDGKVDFKNRFKFTCVYPGELLVKKTPGIQGKPGIDVKGQVILPREFVDIELVSGSGTVLSSDGNMIIAASQGRPVLHKYGNRVEVKILPYLEHFGDVNMESGNIHFSGDILISGDVKDGFSVIGAGKVKIGGIVSHATVKAEDSITINGNVISSTIVAGNEASNTNLLRLIKKLKDQLQKLVSIINQLINVAPEEYKYSLGSLVKIVIDSKVPEISRDVESFSSEVSKMPDILRPTGLTQFAEKLENMLVKAPLSVKNILELENLIKDVFKWYQFFNTSQKSKSDIRMKYALNSNLVATGNVYVTGHGCYNTMINAGGRVDIYGVFRGGEIYARGDIYIKELGSEVGVNTRVYTEMNSKVVIEKAYYNTIVQIDKYSYKFDNISEGINLDIEKLKKS
ncbi:DUF342 domain-containing protein [Thermoanaerobacterium sp. DL9XJH110]|uniref:DUF342 domain-containing protein n=1 Tax=Thermoanaerobacterium sp. DL9XJH110 TaxID=3386643 RepID=UPI003BB4AEA8